MLTKNAAIATVRSFANEVQASGVKLHKVILYGSYAKGVQREHSDIDVALVADEFTGVGALDRKLFSKINIQDKYMYIETKTYPTDYFQSGDPFIDEIVKTGVEIAKDNG